MSSRLVYIIAGLAFLLCTEAAPHSHEKDASHEHESESPEVPETKETKESSEGVSEDESEYQDTEGSDPVKEKRAALRDDLLRPLALPETYGIPEASKNPDMMALIDILGKEGTPTRFR